LGIPLRNAISDYWLSITARGLVAVLFGVMAFIWQDVTLHMLIVLFGGVVLLDGAFSLIFATRINEFHDRMWMWMLIVPGILGVVLGITAIAWPAETAVSLLYFVAVWAIAVGLLEFAIGIQLGSEVGGGWMLTGCGIWSTLFGMSLVAWPHIALHGLIWLLGACAIFFGAALMFLGLRIRSVFF